MPNECPICGDMYRGKGLLVCSPDCLAQYLRTTEGDYDLDFLRSKEYTHEYLGGFGIGMEWLNVPSQYNNDYKSDWERQFAKFLRDCEIDYLYEPFVVGFQKADIIYLPDFLILNKHPHLIEVKGLMINNAAKKLRTYKKYASNIGIPLTVLDNPSMWRWFK